MVRTFKVRLNAAHPELPLMEATAIVGSASTAFIYGVPASIGSWHITKVYVQATFPDESEVTIEARVGAEGIYTATLPMTMYSGRTRSGFVVLADGIDEGGEPVTGYVLGIADFAVYTKYLEVGHGTVAGATLRYFDIAPTVPKEGDVAVVDNVLKLYNGTAWVPFAEGTAETDYSELTNKPQINGVTLSGNKTASDLGLASKEDATLTDRYSAWTCSPSESEAGTAFVVAWAQIPDTEVYTWAIGFGIPYEDFDPIAYLAPDTPDLHDLLSATFYLDSGFVEGDQVTATRTKRGYQLGDQADKPVASQADMAAAQAAIAAKYTKPNDGIPKTDLAAAVQASLDKADAALPKTDVIDPVTASATGKAADALKVKERTAINTRGGTDWVMTPPNDPMDEPYQQPTIQEVGENLYGYILQGHPAPSLSEETGTLAEMEAATSLTFAYAGVTATRTVLKGYVLGNPADNTNPNKDKPIAKQEDLAAAEAAIAAKYAKPAGGIPSTDMSEAVQTSLAKADSALQSAPVSSVNSKTGAVTLYGSDVAMSSQDSTTVAAAIAGKQAALSQTQLNNIDDVPNKADASALRYALSATITATATLADRTMNNVAPAADNTQNIVLSFPAAVTGKARDFCALVTNTTGNTGTISFSPPSGATIYGDGFGTIPASGETYLYNVMEIAANTFFTKAVKMESPSA